MFWQECVRELQRTYTHSEVNPELFGHEGRPYHSKGSLATGEAENAGYTVMIVWISDYILKPIVNPRTSRYKLLDVLQALLRTVWPDNALRLQTLLPLTMLLYPFRLIRSRKELTEKDTHNFDLIEEVHYSTFRRYCE
jgi:hypothetical protein